MEIYLIRHTTPLVQKGICYGQADLDITDSFLEESAIIKTHLPQAIHHIYASPLQRCRKLAEHLFPQQPISFNDNLKELNCGLWELKHWDDIPKNEIDPWMNDFVNVPVPGGESYFELHNRVVNIFNKINLSAKPLAVVTHGGVLRSILSYITQTPLIDSFKVFKLHYGCVVKITTGNTLSYQILSNIATGNEQHKPSKK